MCGGGAVAAEAVQQLLAFGREPDAESGAPPESDAERAERALFVQRWVSFSEAIGKQYAALPLVSKTPVDLFRFYRLVQSYGGLVNVSTLHSRSVQSCRLLFSC